MCGIAGFVGAGSIEDLHRMCGRLAHRGPDAEGYWQDARRGIYLGHRRLAVIDIADGVQPMWDRQKRVGVVFNGEIYNHLSLRRELEAAGHRFATDHSDTEVLVAGYRQWGTKLVDRLNGMWAFAILDRERNRLFLSRDRFGKKPIYYAARSDLFAFASELTALVQHAAIPRAVSTLSLKKYYAYGYIPAPRSLYRGVWKLPAGHNLLVDVPSLKVRCRAYWRFCLEPFSRIPRRPEQAWGEQIRTLLRQAVRRRLPADVPLGVFLSGGIDSSAITAFAAAESAGTPLKSFSIGFRESSFDESDFARRAAALLGTDHQGRTFSIHRALALLPEITARLDEPMGDASLLPTAMLCKETRKQVTVALSGDGGDELFAGYDPFRALAPARWYRRMVPRPVHRAVRLMMERLPVSHRNLSLDFKIKQTLRGLSYPPRLWNPVWMGPLEPPQLSLFFNEPADIEEIYSEAIEAWDACPGAGLVDRTLTFFTRLYLQEDILTKTDRASMMFSLEVRSPFLDRDLVDFVRRIPSGYKFRKGRTKSLLKSALSPVIPGWIRLRAKKGFGAPIGQWFRQGTLREPPVSGPENPGWQYFQKRMVEHRAGKRDHRLFLWSHWLLSAYLAQ